MLRHLVPSLFVSLLAGSLSASQGPPPLNPDESWRTLGLMRIRDMTPFGISRFDFLPAHAVAATPGTFAFEFNLGYQNTWALSDNVQDYLGERGVERGEIGPREIADILELPGDAYIVDGELGLVDLTLHYRASEHFGFYATLPYFTFGGGFLDTTIEGFHNGIGISNAGRNFAPRDQFLAVADLEQASIVLDTPPGNEFGDPVFGLRYSLMPANDTWNLVLEGAAKIVVTDSDRLVSAGANDLGVQFSVQRFFERNALYLSLSGVYYQSPDAGLSEDTWIPTLVAGWETRVSQHANFVLQLYGSESTVQETDLDELSARKIQATVGIQWLFRGHVLRFGITENIANFDNTPDIGVVLSFGRILFGER